MTELSILMPTFNGARYLREQIESILNQSRGDFELLVIDDGSTDDSIAIVDEFVRQDSRMRRVLSNGNKGQNRRLVELLEQSVGEFVAIADQDDVWASDRNALLLDAIGVRALAFGRSQLIDGAGRDLGMSVLEAKQVQASKVGPLAALFVPLVSAHAAIIRRSWMDVAAFYGALPFDLALGLEALYSTGLVYIDEAVVRHRIHSQNQMNSHVAASSAMNGRRFSLYRIQMSWADIKSKRVGLFITLNQLSRSACLSVPLRQIFQHLAGTCWNVWYGIGGSAASLEAELYNALSNLSGSHDDLEDFRYNVRCVTQSPYAPVNLLRSWQTYQSQSKTVPKL